MIKIISFLSVLASPICANPACRDVGQVCKMALSDLRPTQFAVGLREVERKQKRIGGLNARDLETYLMSDPVDVILGPGGTVYVVDGHHFALAAQRAYLSEVVVNVVRNYTHLDDNGFWDKMAKKDWLYIYRLDEGPFSYTELPRTFVEMVDDPFRSLASAVILAHSELAKNLPNFLGKCATSLSN